MSGETAGCHADTRRRKNSATNGKIENSSQGSPRRRNGAPYWIANCPAFVGLVWYFSAVLKKGCWDGPMCRGRGFQGHGMQTNVLLEPRTDYFKPKHGSTVFLRNVGKH